MKQNTIFVGLDVHKSSLQRTGKSDELPGQPITERPRFVVREVSTGSES